MEWIDAKARIKENIDIDTNLNNKRTTKNNYRFVKDVPPPCYKVPFGKNPRAKIDWIMLEMCWDELNETGKWDSKAFKKVFSKNFPKELKHGCYNHIIGKIFEEAGLVDSIEDEYYELKHTFGEKEETLVYNPDIGYKINR
jgi:hypothetical protein